MTILGWTLVSHDWTRLSLDLGLPSHMDYGFRTPDASYSHARSSCSLLATLLLFCFLLSTQLNDLASNCFLLALAVLYCYLYCRYCCVM